MARLAHVLDVLVRLSLRIDHQRPTPRPALQRVVRATMPSGAELWSSW